MLNTTALEQLKTTEQFQKIEQAGLKLVSTPRQIENGTLSFKGDVRINKRSFIRPSYQITAPGFIISNKFSARIVDGRSQIQIYQKGLDAVVALLEKRMKMAS